MKPAWSLDRLRSVEHVGRKMDDGGGESNFVELLSERISRGSVGCGDERTDGKSVRK